ncbi:response regulator [uncultured Rhodoferax sp.]|uniref:response regulator n=1 Tax=uncultured Rhodoferax sp. TaxID=223188 RepID=UPI00260136B4|nr:response regulator [uncultured Rhodoferax sp.]
MSATRFLVADSSPAIQTFLRQLLEGYGFEPADIKTVSTPQAAIEVAAEHQPLLLLTDNYSKDQTSGMALHQAVLSHNPQCRFGLMAANLDATLQETAEAAGALFVLGKPFTAPDIRAAVAQALETLSSQHPQIASRLRPHAPAPRRQIPLPPRIQAGDAVMYQGRYETVKNVILRQGEMVVLLAGTPGMVPASKLSKR